MFKTFKNARAACAIAALAVAALTASAQTDRAWTLHTTSASPQDQWAAMKNNTQEKSAVVRPMGYGSLTPVPESGVLHKPFATRRMQKKAVPTVSADYKMPAQIFGLPVYSNKWSNGNGSGSYGVYTFTADKPGSAKAVVKNDAFAANGGATYANGRLHVLNYETLWGLYILSYDYYAFSTQYWDELTHNHVDDVTRLMSACSGYDQASGQYYAIMYTEDNAHQVFGTLDYQKNTRKVIRQLDDAENVLAMAITRQGMVYAVRTDGVLVTIDKTNGRMTEVGPTGVTPKYLQSAAIDPRTGRMFWAACSAVDPVGLYEVDLETGKATLIGKFANSEEYVGLYIPAPSAEEDAPAACSSLSTVFTADELEGSVKFRLPQKTYAGDAIEGTELGYRVYIDDQLAAEGSGEPGTVVQPEMKVGKDAMYRFEVCAWNTTGEGPRIHLDKFIGRDAPVAPTNVKLTKTGEGNQVRLTWSAPSTGVNKGYVNRDNLNYTIVRYPDEVTVAEHVSDRTFTEELEVMALANYYYVVTAYNGDIEGRSAESNRMLFGTAIEPPYFEDFEDTKAGAAMFTIIDANKDGNTWAYGYWNGTENADLYYTMNEDRKTPADDWAITSPVHMKEGRFYRLTFDVNNDRYFGGTEKISAWVGSDKTVAAMTTEVVPTTDVTNGDPMPLTGVIKSDKDALCYIGFHAQSPADQSMLELDNIHIDECGVFAAPDTVANFTLTPGNNGLRTAKLAFTVPTKNFYGEAIEQVDSVVVYRGKTKRKRFDNPELGSELYFNDSAVPNGMNTYYIYTYNSYGCGIPAERTAWVGIDVPTEPTDVKLVMSGLTAKLTWKAPTTGVHGGFVRPSDLTYNIEDMNSYIKADHRAGTSFSESRGSKQEILYYRVSAQNGSYGSGYTYSNTVVSGSPYPLPFRESFAGAKTEQLWTAQYSEGFSGEMGYTQGVAADGDQGAAIMKFGKRGEVAQLTSGKISLKSASHPMLEFYYYAVPGQQSSLSVGVAANGDAENVKLVTTQNYATYSGAEGWRKVRVDLSDYLNTDYILLSFIGQASGARFGDVAFDAITVSEQHDNDLAVEAFLMPDMVEAGKTVKAVVTVANVGRQANGDYTVQLLKNGLFADEIDGRDIAAGKTADFTFEIATAVTDAEENVFEARVEFAADADQSNNAATHSLTIERPLYPAPVAGPARVENDELRLSWTAPDLTPRNVMTTEGFENYEAFSISNVGNWTLTDGDKKNTAAIVANGETVVYDHVGEPMAFQVFNTELAGLGGAAQLQPHEGRQMLINMMELNNAAADDWLISPELLGSAQTISFWVKSIDATHIEQFEVLASQSGTAAADFSVVESSATEAPADWTEVTAELPQGTKYFALHVKGAQKFMLMVDDISYARFNTADLKLLGYNIYWEGELINDAPIAGTSYATVWFGGGEYRVSAVYEQGESAPSDPFSIDADGISTVDLDDPAANKVYDLSGRKVAMPSALPKGVYIVNGRKHVVK